MKLKFPTRFSELKGQDDSLVLTSGSSTPSPESFGELLEPVLIHSTSESSTFVKTPQSENIPSSSQGSLNPVAGLDQVPPHLISLALNPYLNLNSKNIIDAELLENHFPWIFSQPRTRSRDNSHPRNKKSTSILSILQPDSRYKFTLRMGGGRIDICSEQGGKGGI